ncbi:MAG: ATP-binding cassette domain-containing protein [Myxococcota bacterium]|nr:ATP-binding cassette domain-containing protein [Myxococcota bacterium]
MRAGLGRLGDEIAQRGAWLDARAAGLSGANEVMGAGALAVAVGASRGAWLGPAVDGGTTLAFAVAFFLAYRPLRELADARLVFARAQGAYAELGQVLHDVEGQIGGECPAPREFDRAINASVLPPVSPPVSSRVWPAGALELRELLLVRGASAPLSLRIDPGLVVVITGPTGAGKTTLLRTLLGFERVAGGQVLFAGASIGDAPAGPSSRPFAWVPQDAPLLADTLEANIALGVQGPGAHHALDPIGAQHLIRSLEDARLGPGGRPVSGGERQWIALARAIATCQPVLLLDEPTSGLDADAQRRVLDAVASLRGKRTVLLVTHRPEPIGVADIVVRLNASDAMSNAA